ncbi:MAG: stage V sporulation protein D [Erysipelotrichaceae bacterium]|nr:stage V sporulation protein D [Erysipelotrichaceae bacterium]
MIPYVIVRRIQYTFSICIIVLALIICKLGYLQFFQYDFLMGKAMDLWHREFTVSALRGSIIDTNYEELAYDVPSLSVVCVPNEIMDKAYVSNKLSKVLNCDANIILNKLNRNVSTQKLQPEGRLISDEQANAINELNLTGVYLVQDSKRYYPNKAFLSHVLGFTGIDNQGLAGLELQYDELLKAYSGSIQIIFDAKGKPLKEYHQSMISPGSGMIVQLTIDKRIQDVVERELHQVMLRYEPKNAWALVMDPNSGAILAMASKPDFDPNSYQEYDASVYNQNLPVWKNYEPGSTFKSIVFAMALNENLFDMNKDKYNDRGYEIVEGARLKSWKAGGHGVQTFLEVLQNSSNPGFVEISRRLGKEKLVQYLEQFHFGEKLNVDLPGESGGILFSDEQMGDLETATTCFGQGISVTTLQLVSAFCAVVNGGYMYKPYITKAFLDPYTKDEIVKVESQLLNQVIEEETSFKMRYALEHVVALGGGRNAYLDGYRIGGKTGTAQKAVNGVYLSNEYILSFISAAPIDDPKVVIFMAVDAPKNDVQYGGTVVAPVVKEMYADILPLLNVKPVKTQVSRVYQWLDPIYITIDNYVGKSKKELPKSMHFVFSGEGEYVIDQLPVEGTKIEENGEVWLYFGEKSE